MGQRRMFSAKIINSARFLKMPIDAQNLYFHLGLRADDDGIVEAFMVMRLIGSTEDNLKILHAKGFVRILNEDLVTYITDWLEHNQIRADRKIDSIYKDLLIQIIPDVQLLETKERADRKRDDNGTSQGQPMGSVSKDKLSKDKLSKDKTLSSKVFADEEIPLVLAKEFFNLILVNNPKAKQPDFQIWAKQIDVMMRNDKRTEEDVRRVIAWSQQDSFWMGNILSPKSLRKQFDALMVKMQTQRTNIQPQQTYSNPFLARLKEMQNGQS